MTLMTPLLLKSIKYKYGRIVVDHLKYLKKYILSNDYNATMYKTMKCEYERVSSKIGEGKMTMIIKHLVHIIIVN